MKAFFLCLMLSCRPSVELSSPLETQPAASEPSTIMESKTVSRNQMNLQWRTEKSLLYVTMSAPTSGWVAVGFNTKTELDGSLLLMGAVLDGTVRVEEHIAQPPNHPPRTQLGGKSSLLSFSGEEKQGTTTISFVLDLSKTDEIAPVFQPGDELHVTLAFSQEDDFQHHSMMRTALSLTL